MNIEFTELTIRILLLFIPGIITNMLVNKLTERKKENNVYFFIRSFIYGIFSYFLLYIICMFLNWIIPPIIKSVCINQPVIREFKVTFLECLINTKKEFNILEIIYATIIALPLSFIVSYIENKNLINKIAQKLNISNKFGENDVWSYVFSSLPTDVWAIIRDFDKKLIYEGWPSAFSFNYTENELFLENVTVYDLDSNKLYEIDSMYITMEPNKMNIEFRKVEYNDKEG